MANVASAPIKSIAPDTLERVLAAATVALLAAVLTALAKGHAQWAQVPAVVWPHLLTIIVALALTPFMLLRRRGDRTHRVLGTVWMAAMFLTAVLSLFVQVIRPGHFTWIHLLSALMIVAVPRAYWAARRHRIETHRRIVRAIVIGALLIAGFFTFPFDRLLGHWLFA